MKILNGSLEDHIPGVEPLYLSYMVDFFPAGQPTDKVYRDHVLALAESWEQMGLKEVCGDIEYVTGRPESIIYQVTDPIQRPLGYEVLAEITTIIKEVYTGKIGWYNREAGWDDYFAWRRAYKATGPQREEFLQSKFDHFLQWENQLRVVSAVADVMYPGVYGQFAKFYGVDTVRMYNYDWTLDEYREMQAECYEQTDHCMAIFHDKPYRWFFTNNHIGKPYPEGNVDWQLEKLRKYRKPAIYWNGQHSKYVPLSDVDRGAIIGHNG